MDCRKTGEMIRALRLEKGMTQKKLAEEMHVSEQAVSKWERGLGCPDVALLADLSRLLGVQAETLLLGQKKANAPDGGNMKRIKFYQCPDCGNLLTATGNAEIICCGKRLSPMKMQAADELHALKISDVEDEKLLSWLHPMEKAHHLTFVAAVGYDRVQIVRLYPEGASECRLPRIPWAKYFCGCSEESGTLFWNK